MTIWTAIGVAVLVVVLLALVQTRRSLKRTHAVIVTRNDVPELPPARLPQVTIGATRDYELGFANGEKWQIEQLKRRWRRANAGAPFPEWLIE